MDSRWLPWIIAGVAGAVALFTTLWALHFVGKSTALDAEPVTFTVDPPSGQTMGGWVTISADGRRIVFDAADASGSRLYTRTLDEVESHLVPGSDGAEFPFFSPDGKWLAFYVGGNLVRVPPDGGSPVILARNLLPADSWWTVDHGILIPTMAVTRQRSGLSQIPVTGGIPKVLLVSDTIHRENMRGPFDLSGEDHFFVTSLGPGGVEDDNLAIGSFALKDYKVLDLLAYKAFGYLDGHVIIAQSDGNLSSLAAVPVDLRARKISGDPVTLRGGVTGTGVGLSRTGLTGTGIGLSRNGTLAYLSGESGGQLMWVDESGKPDTLLNEVRAYGTPKLSPNGRQIAVWLPGGTLGDVWIYDLGEKTLSKLTNGSGENPDWTPDGKNIVFVRTTTATAGVYIQPVDGSGEARRLDTKLPIKMPVVSARMSPDGSTVLFDAGTGGQRRNIYYFRPGSSEPAHAWLATDFDERAPRFSPDGKWIAYESDESGSYEVYVRPFPGPGGRVQISSGGGGEAMWSHDGRTVYYRSGIRLMAADLAGAAVPSVTRRRQVMTMTTPISTRGSTYDVSPDGKKILLSKPAGGEAKLVVVVNWFTEVRRKLAEAGK